MITNVSTNTHTRTYCSSTRNNRWELQTAHIPIYCGHRLFFMTVIRYWFYYPFVFLKYSLIVIFQIYDFHLNSSFVYLILRESRNLVCSLLVLNIIFFPLYRSINLGGASGGGGNLLKFLRVSRLRVSRLRLSRLLQPKNSNMNMTFKIILMDFLPVKFVVNFRFSTPCY